MFALIFKIVKWVSTYTSCSRQWGPSTSSWHHSICPWALEKLFQESLSEGAFWGDFPIGWILCGTNNLSIIRCFRSEWCDCCSSMCSTYRVRDAVLLQPAQEFNSLLLLFNYHYLAGIGLPDQGGGLLGLYPTITEFSLLFFPRWVSPFSSTVFGFDQISESSERWRKSFKSVLLFGFWRNPWGNDYYGKLKGSWKCVCPVSYFDC